MFEYGQIIEYIDGTYDENFNNALSWCNENYATLDELVEERKEEEREFEETTIVEGEMVVEKVKRTVLIRYFQINKIEIIVPIIPEPTLDELKQQKKKEINRAREAARYYEGAEFDDDIFDVDETSQSNILAQIKVAELLQNAKATYPYRSKTNVDHMFNVEQLQQLGLTIAQKVTEIYQKSWDLKAKVDEAQFKEDLDLIVW